MTRAQRIGRLAVLACAVAALLGIASAAAGATAPLGALTPLANPFGCYLTTAAGACSAAPDLDSIHDVAVSPSANVLYAISSTSNPVSDYTLSAFALDPATGRLGARIGCLQYIVIDADCTGSGGVYGAGRLAVGPDGRGLYAITYDGSVGGLSAFGTNPVTGAITGLTGCFTESGVSCASGDPSFTNYRKGYALALPRNLAVSPDGRTVYTAAGGNRGGLAAFARDTSTGALTTELNCVTGLSGPGTDTPTCALDDAVEDASNVAASNLAVYAGSDHQSSDHGSVVAFARDSAAGTIQARLGCLQQPGGAVSSCSGVLGGGLVAPEQMALAPGGGTLYVGSDNATGSVGELASIHLTASGVPSTPLAGCLKSAGGDACTLALGVRSDAKLAVSADGRRLYATDNLDERVAAFALDPSSGAAQAPPLSCAARSGVAGCSTASNGAALVQPSTLAIGPGASVLYAGGYGNGGGPGGLALFGIEVPPSCAARSASTTASTPVAIPLACTDPNGDALALSVASAPANGTLGAVLGGAVTYAPAAGFVGVDSFAYRASDGTASSAAATVTVTVTAPGGGAGGSAPGLSFVSLTPARFRAAARGATLAARRRTKRPPVGATLRYTLSASATVTGTLRRAASGRRHGRACVAPTRRNRTARPCPRWVALRGKVSRASGSGPQRVRFSGRWNGRALPTGAYRLLIRAANGFGRSAPQALGFRIVR